MSATFIQDFGILFLIIVVVSFLVKVIKQPIIMGYVLAGLIFSFMIHEESRGEQIIILSELGITFLLFLMGLEFDLKSLKHLGKDILITTLQQSLVFFGVSFGLALAFGFGITESVYLGILFMFSSTLLVAKWIDDKKENNTLYGKITLGTLIVQDVIAIIALSFLSVVQENSLINIIIAPLTGIGLLLFVILFTRYFLNYLFKIAVRYPELLFIFSLGVCFLFVEIAPLLGYSTTIGAFLAGITIANTLYKNDVYTRLKPLIVFFNMLFFVGLGFQIKVGLSPMIILYILVMTILSLTLKPIVIYLTMKMRGYDMKTSFITGISLSQLSEFGIIIIAGGISGGVISKEIGAISVISIILTMILSSYLIKYDKKLFKKCEKYLMKIDSRFRHKSESSQQDFSHEHIADANIIFFGYHDIGKELISKLSDMGKKLLVIENDPSNIELLKKEGIPYIYNTINNPEFIDKLNLSKTEMVISSLIDIEDNKAIISHAKLANPNTTVILSAKNLKDSIELYNKNADYVICPTYLNEQQVTVVLEDYATDNISKLINKKIKDYAKLKEIESKRNSLVQHNKFLDIDDFFKRLTTRREPVSADIVEAKADKDE